ncbi:MAG: hypothetical protein A2X61_08810 [Ignavibacteria bacterium GWB2_35_12]|nr:MAG: hypothetical protein A2X63_04410 [Ignavibacteria bacterium GWA2_35_8]OGU40594.1 MAG: hypothetical protein A2X61_08810 [Ignavibacteria bacterium GWB2_35_12]OGU91658.1 MAG: hypothetical protein A2220_10460 [Ignavibacteria bacterium RIFOXYA2_FULL_35_10]OGV22628.1 MAG: hypothetical protein A2475_13005 [Ignavibacteria bacterium RIFOXYC2_FULL_35_21]
MNNEIEQVISKIQKVLKGKYIDFKGVYFYGSRVKDNYNNDSDYDLVIAFDREIDWKFKYEIRDIIYDIELKSELMIDAKIYDIKEILNPVTPFRKIVKEEGIFYAG